MGLVLLHCARRLALAGGYLPIRKSTRIMGGGASKGLPNDLKPSLGMLAVRADLQYKKRLNLSRQKKREVAELCKQGSEARARSLTEYLIAEDYMMETLSAIQWSAELLKSRLSLLEAGDEPRPEVAPQVAALLHAATIGAGNDVPELAHCTKLLSRRYAKAWAKRVAACPAEIVDAGVLRLLTQARAPPPAVLVDLYLHEIAKAHGVTWHSPKSLPSVPLRPPPSSACLPSEDVKAQTPDADDALVARLQQLQARNVASAPTETCEIGDEERSTAAPRQQISVMGSPPGDEPAPTMQPQLSTATDSPSAELLVGPPGAQFATIASNDGVDAVEVIERPVWRRRQPDPSEEPLEARLGLLRDWTFSSAAGTPG